MAPSVSPSSRSWSAATRKLGEGVEGTSLNPSASASATSATAAPAEAGGGANRKVVRQRAKGIEVERADPFDLDLNRCIDGTPDHGLRHCRLGAWRPHRLRCGAATRGQAIATLAFDLLRGERQCELLAHHLARKPTECCCQPVACMIDAMVAPWGCLSSAGTDSCLLPARVASTGAVFAFLPRRRAAGHAPACLVWNLPL
jgi:hypothetical protein